MTSGEIINIDAGDLVSKALEMQHEGYRLVQICATTLKEGGYELNYSFAMDYNMVNLRITIAKDAEIFSISHIFEPAFLYENEIVDLFGVRINLINKDYKGNLYRIEAKTPFQ